MDNGLNTLFPVSTLKAIKSGDNVAYNEVMRLLSPMFKNCVDGKYDLLGDLSQAKFMGLLQENEADLNRRLSNITPLMYRLVNDRNRKYWGG